MTPTHSESPISSLETQLERAWPVIQRFETTSIAAVSGGADSTALLCALAAIDRREAIRRNSARHGTLIVAHYNHGWRGEESAADEEFVRRLAAQFALEFVVKRSERSLPEGESEASAREDRYRFLTQLAAERGARFVATGHTADDQVETVLFRILRGTGIAGLGGIPAARALNEATTLVRPLLSVKRIEIERYLHDLGRDFRSDSSNQNLRYSRNRLRHEILPLLESFSPGGAANSLLTLAEQAAEMQQDAELRARHWLERFVTSFREERAFSIKALSDGTPEYVLRTGLVLLWSELGCPVGEMTFVRWKQTLAALRSGVPFAADFPGDLHCRSDGETCRLSAKQSKLE